MKTYLFILIIVTSLSGNTQAPSLFQYNQSTFQAFYFFKNVMIDSLFLESDDWVGTFNCMEWDADSTYCNKLGSCVGSRRWNTENCGGGICDLPAMGNVGDSTQDFVRPALGYLFGYAAYRGFKLYISMDLYAAGDACYQHKTSCKNVCQLNSILANKIQKFP